MENKNIIILAAAGIAAYLLLGKGDGGIGGGGTDGSKKGSVYYADVPGGGETANPPSNSVPTPTSSYQPQIEEAFRPNEYGMTPLSKKAAGRLWSSDTEVSNVLDVAKSQNATIYTAPKANDSRMVEYYVEIGGKTGISPTTTKKEILSGRQSEYNTAPTYGKGF